MTRPTRPRALRWPASLVLLFLGVLLATLAGQACGQAPPTAPGPLPSFTFTGRGWGHGVGMSQWGARGFALRGWSAARILAWYYRGTQLSAMPRRTVRVLLATGRRRMAVTSPAPWAVAGPTARGRRVLRARAGRIGRVRPLPDGRLLVSLPGGRVIFSGRVELVAAKGSWLSWGPGGPRADRSYRGHLRLLAKGDAFSLVNVVDFEQYLQGVVPSEMPASWGDDAPAALVAQAVAARSFALATMKPTRDYDVFPDQRSQVYGGVRAEDPRTSAAVRATRHTVLTYDGSVITALFFSTSGGQTENVENVFQSPPRPYLVSVPDPFDNLSPYHAWPDAPTFGAARLGQLLGVGAPVASVQVLARGVSPRVTRLRVTAVDGRSAVLAGTAMRQRLGLRDTWFDVTTTPAPAAR